MTFVQRELHRLRIALLDHNHPKYQEIWAAQQALAWALDPSEFAPPFDAIMGNGEAPGDCSVHTRLPSSSNICDRLNA